MSSISEWSTKEEENTRLDDLTLSGEGGQYINKVMCAVKAMANSQAEKDEEQDEKLASVAGGLVFRGTKETYADLEAVDSPATGDMYSVTALGGENYAWNGEAWDSLGTSDANVVHKTGNETIAGAKTFSSAIIAAYESIKKDTDTSALNFMGGSGTGSEKGAKITLYGGASSSNTGSFSIHAGKSNPNAWVDMVGKPDGTLTWNGQSIQTSSDERIKTRLSAVPGEVLDAWGDVEWGQFQFLAAVEGKGADKARLHLGLIAQHVKAVFETHGLDACAYGILCHEEREATEEEGAIDLWMVRYAEAQAMEAAFQRRRADRLESRVAVLEASLNGVN